MPSFHLHQEAQAASYGHNAAILLGCLRPERRVECLREGLKKIKKSVEFSHLQFTLFRPFES